MYRVLKRMQDGVNLYISSGTSLGVLKRAQDAVNLYSSSGTRYVDGDIQEFEPQLIIWTRGKCI